MNKDFYLTPWWLRKRGHKWKIKIITAISTMIMVAFAMLIAWLMIGCTTIR